METKNKNKSLVLSIDEIPHGDEKVGGAIFSFAQEEGSSRQSLHRRRVLPWVENILFSNGQQYVDNVILNRLAVDSDGNQSLVVDAIKNTPRPTNDLLGRYTETNIALLTENKPRPRCTAKSDRADDITAAELSELTLEYLWEALNMPEKHREIARIILHCGVAWLETVYDPTIPRRMKVPQLEQQPLQIGASMGLPGVNVPGSTRSVEKRDTSGKILYDQKVEYGDITSTIISPFEMHLPYVHYWDGPDMGWILREQLLSIQDIDDMFGSSDLHKALGKKDGWNFDKLDSVEKVNVHNLPIWWWSKLTELTEGQFNGSYFSGPEDWKDYTTVRYYDRKPCKLWPNGRSCIVVGNKVVYDSPTERGARAYDPRWPTRWHPYTRYRWEGQIGSVYGRSLISKLLPKLKRINSIDTASIMWRRTVPIATWVIPKGTVVVENSFSGGAGKMYEYDPIRTRGTEPKPVFPPPFPESAMKEREQQLAEMEAIAGTEEILRGQRPTGVNSAAMIDILRKQALASRSATLQSWDESLQLVGSILLQETIKNVNKDERYAERIKVLAREKHSRLSIKGFSGADLSDNVVVRVDTISMALVSKEAREAKTIEFLQYSSALMQLPLGLRQSIIEELGFKRSLNPQGPDIDRAKNMISWIRNKHFDRVIPMQEDDPYVFYEMFKRELQAETFWDLDNEQQMLLLKLIDAYKQMIQAMETQAMQTQIALAQQGVPMKKPGEQ